MLGSKKFLKRIASMFLIGGIFFSSFVNANAEEFTYTKEQQKEIESAKQRTEQAIKNWDKEKQTKFSNKGDNINILIGGGGDILLTLDSASSDSSAWAGGHAGIVYDSSTVIESFGNKGDLNGVRKWANNWTSRYTHFKQLRINGATSGEYSSAATYAAGRVGLPYNYDFFNVTTTTKFYCSQLVWRAWYNLGYNLNDGGAVWPVDLDQSSKTYVVYMQ